MAFKDSPFNIILFLNTCPKYCYFK
jgi:hypothetical protein